jgi:hypothetical protein
VGVDFLLLLDVVWVAGVGLIAYFYVCLQALIYICT